MRLDYWSILPGKLMCAQIVVNGRFLSRRMTGVERYAVEITRRFGTDIRICQPKWGGIGAIGHAWEQISLPMQLGRYDLLWSPANVGPLLVKRQVLTLHDMSWLEHPEWFRSSLSFGYRKLLPLLARQVVGIITDSNYTKIRIIDQLQISEKQLYVIPCGVDSEDFYPVDISQMKKICLKYGIEGEYILFVGSLSPHKNLTGLIEAWTEIISQAPDLWLVVVGASNRTFANHRQSVDQIILNRRHVLALGYVPDNDLRALYSGALAYVQPSRSEGFGLTVLEAMACGAPVLSSRAGALPEVAGEAALYFDPDSLEDFVGQLKHLIGDADLRDSLRQAGLARAANYSWELTASEVQKILQDRFLDNR